MEINEYLVSFFNIVREIESINMFEQKSKLSGTEFRMLREIILEREKGKDIISSELSRRLGITRSAVSQIVTKLEKKNIVKRTASDTDRKIAYVRLSDHANRVISQVVQIYGEDKMNELVAACKELSRVFGIVCERKENKK